MKTRALAKKTETLVRYLLATSLLVTLIWWRAGVTLFFVGCLGYVAAALFGREPQWLEKEHEHDPLRAKLAA